MHSSPVANVVTFEINSPSLNLNREPKEGAEGSQAQCFCGISCAGGVDSPPAWYPRSEGIPTPVKDGNQ